MTDDPTTATRLLIELQARIGVLEGWRAHQSELLDSVINGRAELMADREPEQDYDNSQGGADVDDEDTGIDADRLIGWVHRHVAAVIARPLRGEIKWCPLWWEHPEAVFRFEALRRAWTQLAPEAGVGMSIWIRDHLDPCLRELLSPLGPFADCSHNERFRTLTEHVPLPTLPTASPDR
ncbi:DUF4913 domain-containing protein [Pseudonocardia sp. KRD-182]|uniref:DUF4913 domain-containing protein n=1 Tax=Pseudonocardia oceani TaxID=2792013 RepID=UPI001C4A0F4A|nr:DUF4913 domain-containing protein [Pseudonocardia oceani]MBW0107266.1 DUF4913 domain-containing protein [Pseudonocardia oceani]